MVGALLQSAQLGFRLQELVAPPHQTFVGRDEDEGQIGVGPERALPGREQYQSQAAVGRTPRVLGVGAVPFTCSVRPSS